MPLAPETRLGAYLVVSPLGAGGMDAVRSRLPGLSRTTVYRVLETLVGAGFVRKVQHAGGVARFDPITERHHHLVCEACGRLVDIGDAAVPTLRLPETRGTGFRVTDYSVSFLGLCGSCTRGGGSGGGEAPPRARKR